MGVICEDSFLCFQDKFVSGELFLEGDLSRVSLFQFAAMENN